MAIQIDWQDFSKDQFEDIRQVVESNAFRNPKTDETFQRLQDASIQIGGYEGRVAWDTNSDDLAAAFGSKTHPNVLALSIQYHPKGSEFYLNDGIEIPLFYGEGKHQQGLFVGTDFDEPANLYETFQKQIQTYVKKYAKEQDYVAYPELLNENYKDTLRHGMQKKYQELCSFFPTCKIVPPENKAAFPALEDPDHPFLVLTDGMKDFTQDASTAQFGYPFAVNEELLQYANGEVHGGVESLTPLDEDGHVAPEFYSFVFCNGENVFQKPCGTYIHEANNLAFQKGMEVVAALHRMEDLVDAEPEKLPPKEGRFVKHYQKLLQEERDERPWGKNSLRESSLFHMASEAAKYAVQHIGISKKKTAELLNEYAPGADPYKYPSYGNRVMKYLEKELSSEKKASIAR